MDQATVGKEPGVIGREIAQLLPHCISEHAKSA